MQPLLSTPLAPEAESRVIRQLTALAQSARLNIFRELIKVYDSTNNEHGIPAGDLALRLQMPAPTLSFHLKELSRANLVTSSKAGRSVIYRANCESVRSLIEFLLKDCCSECC